MGELAAIPKRQIKLPVGLLLSIGSEKPERGPGRPIDWFRAKPGKLEQYEAAAAKFSEHYGLEPKSIDDVHFLSNEVPDALDIRLAAFSESGIRGIGQTNFASIMDESEFEDRVFGANAFTDDFLFFPKDVDEVRAELRENWEGEPIHGTIDGREDARIERFGIKIVATLEFCLPEIMGLGTVARISTSSRNSIRNLYKGLWTEWQGFGYRLSGIPFRLSLRAKPTQRFDKTRKVNGKVKPGMVATTIYELVIDTPHTIGQLREALEMHRAAFGQPSRERLELEGRILRDTLALPMAGEEEATRDEPLAEAPDPVLNRIAALENEIGDERAISLMLLGAFGVSSSAELTADQAERYVAMLERAAPAEEITGEIVDELAEDTAGAVGLGSPGSNDESGTRAQPAESAEGPEEEATSQEGSAGGSIGPLATEKRRESPSADEVSGAEEHPLAVVDGPPVGTDSASDELPGEPGPDENLVELAAETLIPIGQNKGTPLGDIHDDWLKYALRNESRLPAAFVEALELFVRERRPELWVDAGRSL